jgi:uncharacterized membrane protein YkoI
MKKKLTVLPLMGLIVLGFAVLGAWAGDAYEEEITLDEVPAVVRDAIEAAAGGAEITEVERETKDGRTFYEAEFVVDGREVEIRLAADGTIISRKVEGGDGDGESPGLRPDDVPAGARAAFRKLANGGRITRVSRDYEDGVMVYEAEWMAKGTKHEAAVTEDGTLVEMEERVRMSSLPPAVQAAVARHFPPGTRLEIEKKTTVVYEIEGVIDGEEVELYVFPTGRVHGSPKASDGDDDGADGADEADDDADDD